MAGWLTPRARPGFWRRALRAGLIAPALTACMGTSPAAEPGGGPCASAAMPRSAEDLERYVDTEYDVLAGDLGGAVSLGDVRLLFIGNSITRGWTREGSRYWSESFGQVGSRDYALNLGVSGDRPEHVLYRLLPRSQGGMGNLDDEDIQPEIVFLMIGTNSLWGRDDAWGPDGSATEELAGAVLDVARCLRQLRPAARVVVQSVLPVRDSAMNRDRVGPLNRRIDAATRAAGDFEFLALYPRFVDDGGRQDTTLFHDAVHLNEPGYGQWRASLMAFLNGERAHSTPSSQVGGPQPMDVDLARLNPAFVYPGGARKAYVISMDDGNDPDRTMIAILNRYGLKGTFHLNSGLLGEPVTWFNDQYGADLRYVTEAEIPTLYLGHEISSHSVSHPNFTGMQADSVMNEVAADKARLERITGSPVTGIAYPFGATGEFGVQAARNVGYLYGRLAGFTGETTPPVDPFRWAPTANPPGALQATLDYLEAEPGALTVFLFMGHSYEFVIPGADIDWGTFEALCRAVSSNDDVWSATMTDYIRYWNAVRAANDSLVDGRGVNTSEITLWVSTPTGLVRVPPGRAFTL